MEKCPRCDKSKRDKYQKRAGLCAVCFKKDKEMFKVGLNNAKLL